MKITLREIASTRPMVALYAAAYSFMIDALYSAVSAIFGNVKGYSYHSSSIWLHTVVLAACVAPVALLPQRSARVSESILWILFYVFYIPSVTIPQHLIVGADFQVAGWIAMLFLGFALTAGGHYLPIRRMPVWKVGETTFCLLLIGAWLLFVLEIYRVFGLRANFASVTEVYGTRAEFKNVLSDSKDPIVGYVIILSGYWLAPAMLLIGFCLVRFRFVMGMLLMGMSVLLCAYIYSVAAYKSIALSFVMVVAYYNLVRLKGVLGIKVFLGIAFVVVASWTVAWISGYDFVAHHLVRRAIISPGMDSTYFYDYYSGRAIASGLLPPQAIAINYYGTQGSANAGFLAAGYAMLQAPGVLLVGIGAAIALWVANVSTRGVPQVFAASGFFMQSYALSNSAFSTVMVSYGFTLTALTFFLFPFPLAYGERRPKRRNGYPVKFQSGESSSTGYQQASSSVAATDFAPPSMLLPDA